MGHLNDFDRLYAEYGHPVFRFCHRLLGNRTEAEDLTQDVFVAALTGRSKFRRESSERTWLFRIAVYQARERLRKAKRYVPLRSDRPAAMIDRDQQIDLDRLMDDLPEKLKTAFVLVKLEQFTCSEAAQILGLPEGTVKFHVYSAVKQLQSVVRDSENQNHQGQNSLGEEIPYAL